MNIIYVTCKDLNEAKKIAHSLLLNHLAVCINIIHPVNSMYLWKGNVEKAKETVLLIKTSSSLTLKAVEHIKKYHSYDCPDIISWKVDVTAKGVTDWITDEIGSE